MTPAEQLELGVAETERPPPAGPVVKTCACGRSYDAASWARLPWCGIQDMGEGARAELRHCRCSSTIAIELPPLALASDSDPRPNSPEDLGGFAPAPPAERRGPTYAIPPGAPRRSCSTCAAIIFWIITPNGKRMPVDPDGTSHFATCPDAKRHRRR